MQLTIGLLTLVTALTLIASCAGDEGSAGPRLVEFWRTGDDMLSQQLAHEVEHALNESTDFEFTSVRTPSTLIVKVPSNVRFEQVGKREKALYKVEFSSADGRALGGHEGSCWTEEMAKCAVQIIDGARKAARNIR